MKKFVIASFIVAVAVTGTIVSTSAHQRTMPHHEFAANGYANVGTSITCSISGSGIASSNNADFPDVNVNASGQATLTTIDNDPDEQAQADAANLALSTFSVQTITISGHDDTYGDFSLTFDASRSVPNSKIIANNPGEQFPATADIYANVSGTISSQPGTFTNANTCHMRNGNLNSFNPQQNEAYEFVDDLVLSNDDGTSTITIHKGARVTVN
ncbi:MAG: hypothetical protein JST22_16385 [Bacteroidetes bacterium]|nr:hypothetical protein [Bacteroidota bacterium]